MKIQTVKFFPLVVGAALLSACGDDVTEVNMAGVGKETLILAR